MTHFSQIPNVLLYKVAPLSFFCVIFRKQNVILNPSIKKRREHTNVIEYFRYAMHKYYFFFGSFVKNILYPPMLA